MTEDVNAKNKVTWQRVACRYAGDGISEDDPAMRETVRSYFCERLHGTRVLEVGCGPGTDAAKLAARGLHITATDYAPEFIAIVKRRYPALEARVMDMTEPDLPPSSLDGIYGFASVIHLPRAVTDRTLVALRELLVPGGLLFLVLIRSSRGIREYTIDSWVDSLDSPMVFTCNDQDEMERRLTRLGFVAVEFLEMLPSAAYEGRSRLAERGITSYVVCARRSD